MDVKLRQIEVIENIAECLKVPASTLQLDDSQMLSRTNKEDNSTIVGFVSIIQQLIEESDTKIAKNSCLNKEIVAQIHQWIEFVLLNITTLNDNCNILHNVLKDLNCVLATKSYLVEQFCTVADAIVFHAIRDNMVKIIQGHEKYDFLNLFRWFNHIQQRTDIQEEEKVIKMAKVFL